MSKKSKKPEEDISELTPEEIAQQYWEHTDRLLKEGGTLLVNLLNDHKVAQGEKRLNPYALEIVRRGLQSVGAERWNIVINGKH